MEVDTALAENEDKPVNVLIDSLGGSLATGLSISAAFKNHGNVSGSQPSLRSVRLTSPLTQRQNISFATHDGLALDGCLSAALSSLSKGKLFHDLLMFSEYITFVFGEERSATEIDRHDYPLNQ